MTFQFPELKRPQYPSSPEVLISALAWSMISRTDRQRPGLIYERASAKRSSVRIEPTKPTGAMLDTFCAVLKEHGLTELTGALPSDVGASIANSMDGVRPLRGVGRVSSAIGIAGALLQDPVGGLAVANPPNFAQLINSIYSLGNPKEGQSASEAWYQAASFHATQTPLRQIELGYVRSTLQPYLGDVDVWPPANVEVSTAARANAPPDWWRLLDLPTPFSWFRTSWDRLCSPEWFKKLPPRRWASWAVCVLRHALAFSFLWEANFFHELAKGALNKDNPPETVARWAVMPVRPLMPYRRGSASEMDVMPGLRGSLSRGLACRNAVRNVVDANEIEADNLEGLVSKLRRLRKGKDVEAIELALTGGGDTGGLKNLYETVRYSLLSRSGTDAVEDDNYGLLRTVSRYGRVFPGPEWVVVMAAVASKGPTAVVRLGDLIQSIKALGLQPRIDFLLAELERAGLCASAPDGDEGIEINLGFGRAQA